MRTPTVLEKVTQTVQTLKITDNDPAAFENIQAWQIEMLHALVTHIEKRRVCQVTRLRAAVKRLLKAEGEVEFYKACAFDYQRRLGRYIEHERSDREAEQVAAEIAKKNAPQA